MKWKILDVTCGTRSIWFDKEHPLTLYCDRRREHHEKDFGKSTGGHKVADIDPDVLCDFTSLPFADNSFSLVVFDPTHVLNLSDKAWMKNLYGTYTSEQEMMENITIGFHECMRVLKPDGVLVFKWADTSIPAAKIIKAFGQQPLFGHKSGIKMNTHWMCFMKLEDEV